MIFMWIIEYPWYYSEPGQVTVIVKLSLEEKNLMFLVWKI